MTLPTPVLDDRGFQDIVDACKRMIPRFTPEWTDHNVSDPGVALIELFAWMTEILLYRMNQVPTRNYIKFLEMIGVRLEPPRPARTEVLFRLIAPQNAAVVIAAGTEVATLRTSTQQAIIFATEQPLEITVPSLAYVLVSRDEMKYDDYAPVLHNPMLRVPIFEDPPRPGNGFYLGYHGNLAAHTLRLTLRCQTEGIGVDPKNPPLAWEYYDGALQTWRRVRLESDGTGGLNRDGEVVLHIPMTSRPREFDRRRATWIRCRVTETTGNQQPYSTSPRILGVSTVSIGGSVMAMHSERISQEPLGRSDGTPGQTFTLSAHPLLPRRPGETLEVETETPGVFEAWQEVQSFAASEADDPHFTCDSVSGQITLGPLVRLPGGEEKRYGRIPQQGRALRFTSYRIGGGTIGNVGRNTLTELKSSIPYVAWITNPEPAVGGAEAETLDAALVRGPSILLSSPRAVTAADYERLAAEATPDVARARCSYARQPDDGLAGSVRLVIVPRMSTIDGPVPPEQLALSDHVRTAVQDYLDERRMITVRMVLEAPVYVPVSVQLEVYARPRSDQGQLQSAVERALYRFLHPTVGGPDGTGWPFERPLFLSDIYGVVQAIPDVEHIGLVRLVQIDGNGQEQPVTNDSLSLPPGALLCSATHRVIVR